MTTESGHYYDINGNPRHTMPNKSKPGTTRATTLADARKLGLFPSVSAYLKMKAERGLEDWKQEQLIEACHNEALCWSCEPFTLPIDVYTARVKEIAFTQVGEAADLGTKIHAAIERAYTAQELPEDTELRYTVLGVMDKVRAIGVQVLEAEKVLVNSRFGYAGTSDILFERDGGVGILDFKSKRTKPGQKVFQADSHPMQIAAYWQAKWGMAFDYDFDAGAQGINVYISTTEPGRIEVVEYDDVQLRKAWAAFKACLELYRYSTGYDARVL